jgi:hypothetical protein
MSASRREKTSLSEFIQVDTLISFLSVAGFVGPDKILLSARENPGSALNQTSRQK